jgi:hypothetical protein
MRLNPCGKWCTLVVLLILPAAALSLTAQQTNSLVISGKQGQATVIQVQGRNYVDVEGLARIANGAISFNGNEIVLTLLGSGANSATAPAPIPGFSKDFQTAGIEAMAEIREWHTALKTAIERGLPLDGQWLESYDARAQRAVHLASLAISTDSDKSVYPFVVNVLNNMKTLTDKYLQIAKNRTYIPPNSLQSDPVDRKIVNCTRSLASMGSTNQFIDDGSCR